MNQPTLIIIPPHHGAEIKAFQKDIAKRQKEEDKRYAKLCKTMGITIGSDEDEVVWDHIYNGTKWNVIYAKE